MACLYCGKEIGPFQILRDDEFCGAAHRKQYAERLGKVIGRIGTSDPRPTKMADFRAEIMLYEGNREPVLQGWMHGAIRFAGISPDSPWPVTITPLLGHDFVADSFPGASAPAA